MKNKGKVTEKFYKLLASCFVVRKKRKPTKVPKSVIAKRLNDKSKRKDIKKNRKI